MYPYLSYSRGTKSQDHTIKVYGSYTINVEPDVAYAKIGVLTSNKELAVAQKENAAISQEILQSFKMNRIPSKNIQTSTYQIYPQYDYIEGKQRFKGYEVRQVFQVKMKDLTKIGKVIDDAVTNGANIVESVQFDVEQTEEYYNQALVKAYERALAKARSLGNVSTVGGKLAPVKIVELSTSTSPTPYGKVLGVSSESTTPIPTGKIGVTAKVEVTFQ
ncbi:hypothetical protein Q75_03400 [Bacillus coahuilensis p1.1.43]|uniref:Periplasmic immunogenic protein n=1 Tax=Bacillus coahuilensis p1.1.43 TaxID=1150625 RepID=A0A147KB62_9BACI|nr:SIMPL domain-containing protein [Bacillus coahuilensis]KUP08115.1 hypothetical protein Q75_03400 [Bacillus coahuilensis p1.1.43]